MARVTVYLPDRLQARVREQLPGVVLSRALQEALVAKLDCHHDELCCVRCTAPVDRLALLDDALGRFYGDVWEAIGDLAAKAGTAEGAVKRLRDVGDRWGVTMASRRPLVRSTRAARQAVLDAKLAELDPAAPHRRRRSA